MIALKLFAAVLSLLVPTPSTPSTPSAALIPDHPTLLGPVEVVCTGVGLDARQNPAWGAYPLKIEIAGRGGQYLGDISLTLSRKDGASVATVTCDGPWILFKTAPGAYHVEARTEGQTASSAAYVPATGQGRIIIRFPMLGGDVTPNPAPAPVTN